MAMSGGCVRGGMGNIVGCMGPLSVLLGGVWWHGLDNAFGMGFGGRMAMSGRGSDL